MKNSEKMQSIFYSSGAFDPQELNTNAYLGFQTPTKVLHTLHLTRIQTVASTVLKSHPTPHPAATESLRIHIVNG